MAQTEEVRKAKKRAYAKAYYARNKERHKASLKAHFDANPGLRKAQIRKYCEKNKEKIAEARRLRYAADPSRRKAYYDSNVEKITAYQGMYRKTNRDALLAYHAAKRAERYGVSEDALQSLYLKHGSSCAICLTHESNMSRKMAIDHCHKTGSIRGLLCDKCNLAVGALGDTAQGVKNAYTYLAIHERNPCVPYPEGDPTEVTSRRHKYGLTKSQLAGFYRKCNSACAICAAPEDSLPRRLCIDHSHETYRVRGLLCIPCNGSIGKLGDTAEGVLRAVKYLEDFESGNV